MFVFVPFISSLAPWIIPPVIFLQRCGEFDKVESTSYVFSLGCGDTISKSAAMVDSLVAMGFPPCLAKQALLLCDWVKDGERLLEWIG